MRRHKLSLVIILVSLALSVVAAADIARPVNAVTSNSHVIANTGDHYVYESSYQNPGFFAQGMYWVFFEDSAVSCEGQAGCLFYATSSDGAHFATPINTFKHVTDSDWSIVNSGSTAFYVRYNETSFDSFCNRALLYGTGSLGSNGAITWQSEQVVRAPTPTARFPNDVIQVDSTGQVWIGYQEDDAQTGTGCLGGSGQQTPHIIQNNAPLPTAPLSSGFTFSPTNATALGPETFTANATGGSKSYVFGWNFGDGSPTAMGKTVNHTYLPGNFTVTLHTNDTSLPLQSVVSTQKIIVGPTVPPTQQTNQLTLQVPASQSIKTGTTLGFKVNASDADGEPVQISTNTFPTGATFNSLTGVFSWTPAATQASQTWLLSFNATDSGSPTLFVTRQVLIFVSPFWGGDVSLPATPGSESISANWHVDIATLSGGQVYAEYWADRFYLLGRLFDGTSWGPEENISLTTDSTDVNSFIFSDGSNVYAIWFDTNSGNLNAGLRPPGKTWGQYTIGKGEAKSVLGLPGNVNGHRYSLPFTAAVNLAITPNPQFYVFWYNQTNRVIDQWSGTPGGAWLETPAAFSTQSSPDPELTIGSFHYSAPDNTGKNAFGILWIDGTSPYNLNFGLETVGSIPSFSQDTSWNPKVQCTPRIVTIEQILGSQNNSLGGAAESGSLFNPGIIAPSPGDAKRWLNPPCNITNADGQVISSFVEIIGAERTQLFNEDYSVHYDHVNGGLPYPTGMNLSDTTFNIFTPGFGICNAGNTTGCMHTIHVEFDHDWKAAGYCGPGTTCDPYQMATNTAQFKSLIDFQGFVYWDPDHATEQGHSFSGWELHALTGWRISCLAGQFCSPSFSLNTKPSSVTLLPSKSAIANVTINAFNLFSGPVPLDATVSPTGLSTPTATLNPATAHVQPCNSCTELVATLNITAMPASSGTYIVTVTGHNGTTTRTATITVLVQGFTLSANPQTLTIPAGTSVNSTITVTSVGSFSGTVNLNATVNGCACGFVTVFTPKTVTIGVGGKQNATLTVTAGPQTGNAIITVTGSSGTLTASTTLTVAGVDFTINANPPSSTVLTNRLANSTITVAAVNGFKGTVTLTETVPTGLTCSLSPSSIVLNSTASSGSANLKCSGPVGSYTVIVNANGNSIPHSAIFTIMIQDFTITATPTAVMVNAGSPGTSTIRLSAVNGFAGTIGLSQNGGTACSLGASSVTLSSTKTSADVILTCTYATNGNNNVVVSSVSGPLVHNATITFQVVDFTISANPTSMTVNAGSLGNSTITLTALNGFNRTVTLSVSAPSGLACLFSPSKVPLTLSPATSILSCRSSVANDYTVTVTGINGTLSHPTGSLLFHIVDFTITPLPSSSVTLGVGQSSGTTSIHLGGLNSFIGNVSLNVIVSSSGPSATPSLNSLKLISTGCACNSTVLNINAGPTAGVFTLNVTATNGLLTHWAVITLTVTKANPTVTTLIKDSTGAVVTSVTAGTTVHDTATISGGSQPGGTVTYTFFANGACAAPGSSAGTVSVSNGSVPDSSGFTPTLPGSYSFNANYSGDPNNNKASSSCESLNVTSKLTPTLSTAVKDNTGATINTVSVGAAVHDTATLSGGSTVITGTVTYFFFTNIQCSGPPATGFPPFPQTVTIGSSNSIPASSALIPGAGLYSFNATYSGDATNNPVTSSCEPLTINKQVPVITTAITPSSTITVGASVTDQATLTGGYPSTGVTGSVTYAFFGSVSCASTPISTSTVTVGSGNSVPASASVSPPSAGSFAFNATYGGDTNNTRVSSPCEPLTVNKQTLSITTTISPSSTITVGASVTDQVILSGGFPSTGVTGSVAYAFFTNSACGGSPVSTSTVTVGAGNSVPASNTVTPTSSGSFAFNATYSGDGNNNRVSSSCEPLTVNKQTPGISTTISPASPIIVGTAVTDHATLTGGFPSTGVTGTVSYFFFTGSVCTGTAVSEGTVTIGTGSSVPVSNSVTPSPAGLYSFNATYHGDGNNNGVSSVCEPLTVNKVSPTIATAINPSATITVGASVTDQATLTGGFPSTGVTGSVIYAFFSNGVCTGTATSTSTVIVGSANGVSPSSSTTPSSAGSFAFNATYSGDSNNNRVSSSCEPFTVLKQSPTITTIINQSSSILVGTSVTDQAAITGGFPSAGISGTITYHFFGLGDGICSGIPASSQTVNVGPGNAVPPSNSQTPSSVGQYSFNATYSGDANNNVMTSGCELLTVNLVSTTTGITCGSSVTVGVPTSCTVTVSDVAPGTLTPTGTVNLGTNSTGTFAPPSPCTLNGSASSSSCTFTYTPGALGAHNITATYPGDSNHKGSAGSTILSPGKHSTSLSVSCSSPILANQASTCTATVTDTSAVGATTPTGSVSFTETGAIGSFNVTSCTLSGASFSASCGVRFIPSASGTASIVGSYGGDSTHSISSNTSTPAQVTVNPSLVVNTPSATPSAIDSGQSANLSATFTGGTSPYTCQWLQKLPGSSTYTSLGVSSACTSSASVSTGTLTTVGAWSFELQVTDSSSSPVIVVSAPATVTVNPALSSPTIFVSPTALDLGQSATLTTTTAIGGGTPPYSCQWLAKAPGATSYGSLGSSFACIAGEKPTAPTGILSTVGSWSFELKVTDNGSPAETTTSGTVAVTVNSPLNAPSISAAPSVINSGQSAALSTITSFAGGTSTYSCQWLQKAPAATTYSSLGASIVCNAGDKPSTPTGALSTTGIWSFELQVTDSGSPSEIVASSAVTVTVNGPLSAGTISPNAPTIDAGQSITLTANPTGGTSPYTYQWYSDGICGTPIASATASTLNAFPTSTSAYSVRVTDSASSSACSTGDTVTVNPALAAGSVTPSTPTIDAGQSLTLGANPSGGTVPYHYQWYSSPSASCSSDTTLLGTIATQIVSSAVSTYYCYSIADSAFAPATQSSAALLVTVDSTLMAGPITPSGPTMDSGQNIILTANPSGGATPYSYQWYAAASCTTASLIPGATSSTYVASPASTTNFFYKVTDSSQGSPAASQCSPGDLVTVNPALAAGAITPTNPTIDSGQVITLASHASGGTPSLSYQWYSDGACTTTISGSTSSTYSASPTSTSTYSYKVTDSANSPTSQCSSADTVTVNPTLVVGTITPANPSINGGQTITLTANPSGGTTPYNYQWYSDGLCGTLIASATSSTYSTSPTITTTYSYKVTDAASSPVAKCSPGDTVTVNSGMVAGAITPPNPTIDNGQSITLTSHVSGGTPPFSYQWYSDGTCGTTVTGATASTFTASPTTTTSYAYKVTDSAQSPTSACSAADVVTVNPAMIAAPVTPSAPTIDAGQSITLTSHSSGGTPPISYQWFADGNCGLAISGAISSTYVTTPSVTTTYTYQAKDSANSPVSQCSSADVVAVNSALVANSITPSASTIDAGQAVTLTANPSAGTTPYSYQWYAAASCPSGNLITGATLSTYTASPTATTTYSYKVTDSSQGAPGNSQCSPGDPVAVNPALAAGAVTPANPAIDSGQTVILASQASGGTPSLSYQWYSDGLCTTATPGATSSTYSASPTSSSTYSYKVTDAASSPTSQCSSADIVTVSAALVAGGITPASPSINAGQSVSLVANPSGGTTPYSYQWYSDGACNSLISSATSSTYSASPSVTTTYSYKVTDTAFSAVSRCSPGNTVTVNSAIVAGAITPANPTIDSGQSITLTSHESGGTPTFSYQWYSDGTCASAIVGASSSTLTVSPATTTTYSYKVTDSAQSPASACSSPETVTVNASLNAGPVTPSAPTIDAGQSITLTSHGSGGTPSISYQWFSDAACSLAISGATSSTYVATLSVTTTFAYSVTDSAFSPVSRCSGASSVTVNPALVAGAITPSAPTIDTGQSVTLAANPSGGTTPYGYQWYSAANCPSANLIPSASSSTYSASPTSTTTYSYKATDSSQGSPIASPCSPSDTVTVSGTLSAGAITPNAPTIDSGQSIALNANPSGGSAPYTYQWFSDAACNTIIASATSSSYIASPTATATYSYKVTDFASAFQCSPGDTVTVDPALIAGAITPSSPTIDNGQSVTLTAAASAGTAPYSYQWFVASGCLSGNQISGSTSSLLVASPSSTITYSYRVIDFSQGSPAASVCSAGNTVTVNPALTAAAITPSSPTIDNGQPVALTSNASGGTTPYSYQWFTGAACAATIPGATSATFNASPSSSTTYSYKVTDSAFSPTSQCSPADTVTVNSALVAGTVTPTSPKIDSGQSITLIASPSGGTSPYGFQWYSGLSASCPSDTILLGTTASQVVSPTSNTYYCYSLTDSAFTHASQFSTTDLVTVAPTLSAGTITPASPTIDSGQSVVLNANPTGGTGPYSYQWYSGTSTSCSADTAPLGTSSIQTVSSTSSAYYCYKAFDSSAGNPSASATSPTDLVTVNPVLAISPLTTTSPIDSGQSTTVSASWSGGTTPYVVTLYTSTSSTSCTSLAQVGQNTGLTGTTTTFTESPTTTTSYCASVADGATAPATIQNSSPNTVVVNPSLSVATPTSAASALDSGQQSMLSAAFTGGTTPYTCQWLEKAPGATAFSDLGGLSTCASPASTSTGSLITLGSWAFELQVTDAGSPSVAVTSSSLTVSVNSALQAPTVTASPTTIGSGQGSTISTSISFTGGTSPYACQWLKKGPLDGTFGNFGTSFACNTSSKPTVPTGALLTSGIWSFELLVKDAGSPVEFVTSNAASVTVNGALSAGAIAPGAPAIDSGQSITLTANAFGGVPSYSYQWYSDGTCGTAIPLATSSTYLAFPSATTSYSYNVTDSSSPSASRCSPGDTVTVNPSLTANPITPAAPTIDSGQSIALAANPSGGTSPYSYQWFSDASCTITISGATGSSFVPSPGATTTYTYKLGDSSQGSPSTTTCSAGDTVTVNPALVSSPITPSAPTIDSGQSLTLTSHATGGTPDITYQWYSDAACGLSINGATSSTYTASPTVTTTYSYRATDSSFSPASQCSASDTVTVVSGLVAGPVTPSTPSIDTGQSITLTAHPSGGATPYGYQWHAGSSATCSSNPTLLGTAVTQTVSPIANTYYCYTITDASSASQSSSTDLVSVNPALGAGAVTPSSPSIDAGQTMTFTANPSGGTAPYHYLWYSSPNAVCPSGASLASTATLSVSPTSSTYYCYSVTDSSTGSPSVSATSAASLITVNPPLVPGSITPSSPAIDSGQPIVLTANPSGGTTSYQYQWYSGSSAGCSSDNTPLGTTPTQSVTPTISTYYCYRVTDSSIGSPTASVTSVTDLVAVSPALAAGSITPSSTAIDSGQSVVLTSKASSGVGPYSYQWYSDGACTTSIPSATSSTYVASPALTTTYTYKVTDSANSPAYVCSPSDTINVNPSLVAGQISPLNPTVDNGQSVTLTSHTSGGTPSLSYQWYSDGSCVTPIAGAISSTYVAGSSTTGSYSYKVTDSAFSPASQCSASDTVTVVSGLVAGSITPAAPKIDSGQSITLTANPSGGATPYSYQWYSDGICATAIQSATSSTYIASPTTTAVFSYRVTDSANSSVSQCSASNAITVNPLLIASTPTPSTPTIDAGQTIVLISHISGGTSPLSYQWYSDSVCASLIPGATSSTYVASPTSTTSYSYKVTDSAYVPTSACSPGDSVSVNSALAAGPISPSSPVIDNGQFISLASHASGGTSPLSYQWYSDATCTSAIPGATVPTYSVSLSSTTTFSYRVTDPSQGTPSGSACSSGDTVTVNPALTAGPITPSGQTINNGQSVTLASAASGGTPTYAYQWYSSSSCPSVSLISGATSSTLVVSPSSTTTYSYKVTDSSYSPAAQCSSGDIIKVNPTLAARSPAPPSPTIDAGQQIVLSSQASGGTQPFSYQWYSDGSCTTFIGGAVLPQYLAAPTATTLYSYKVTDSANPPVSECSPGDTVTVNSPLAAGPVTPASPSIDNGQSITLTANPSGGTSSYQYLWYSSTSPACPAGASLGTSVTLAVTPTANTYYCYTVTDSSIGTPPATATSLSDLVVVNPVLSLGTPSATPSVVDSAQSSTLSATISGGVTPYTCQWLEKAPGSTSYSNLGSSSPCTSSASTSTGILATVGAWSFELQITDNANSPDVVTSSPAAVAVNSILSSPTISASPTTQDLGQSSTLTTTTSFNGGTSPYVCQWLQKAPGAAAYSNIGNSFPCSVGDKPTGSTGILSVPGAWSFELKVSDGASPSQGVTSSTALTVRKASPTISVALSSASLTVGDSDTASGTLTGGYQAGGSVTYEYFAASACSGTPATVGAPVPVTSGTIPNSVSQKFNSAGSFGWEAIYSGDSNNIGATSTCQPLTVNSPPSLSIPGAQTVAAGATVRFVVNATDGSKTVTLTASGLPAGATFSSTQSFAGGASSIFLWTPTDAQAPGDYNVTFTAQDSQGVSTVSHVTIHVSAVSKAAPLPILTYSIFGIVGFLAVLLVAVVLRRLQTTRRKA